MQAAQGFYSIAARTPDLGNSQDLFRNIAPDIGFNLPNVFE